MNIEVIKSNRKTMTPKLSMDEIHALAQEAMEVLPEKTAYYSAKKEMNHSDRFWKEVEKILPDYKERKAWLKEHGTEIMSRMI